MPNDILIRAEGLGKKYRLGELDPHRTFRESVRHWVVAPLRKAFSFGQSFASGGREAKVPQDETIWALRDVSLEVAQGDVLGIIGRNGAGKSTLLKILAKITQPTTGRAEIKGRMGSLLEVGTGFHPELTGRENIFFNGAILGMTRTEIKRKFDEIVAFSGVERFLDTPIKRYSSGMSVRLAFAVAAHLEPEVLIVDEVLAVGDAAFQKKCLSKMGEVSREGRAVLFVSHNMAAVCQLCDRGIWLDGGGIKMTGDVSEVVKQYLAVDAAQKPDRTWTYPGDAPGDDRVRLLSAGVFQEGQAAAVVDINLPCRVEMEFQVLQDARNLITGASFYDAQGTCLSASCDWRPNHLAAGRYRKSVEIPAQTFAEGRVDVLVQLVFYDPSVQSAVVPNAVSFEASDSSHPQSVRGLYKGPWPGLLRLGLDWSNEQRLPAEADGD